MRDHRRFKTRLSQILRAHGLTELGSYQHKFRGSGFTAVVCLAESHVAVHTWPELGYVTLDVHACHFSRNNARAAAAVFDEIAREFRAFKVQKRVLRR